MKSMNDALFAATKAMAGDLPFAGPGGYGVGAAPIYTSWDAWDRTINSVFARSNDPIDYAAKLGDPTQNSLIMAAVRFLGSALPVAPLVVKQTEGAKGDSEVVPGHGLAKLWARPNAYYSGSTMNKAIAFSWIIRGDVYLLKFKNPAKSKVMELWYEPHWTIRPRWPEDNSEYISYYEVNRGGRWYRVEKENVIHFRDGIDPLNPRCGLSSIGSILRELYGDDQAAVYFANLLGGSGVPSLMVSIDKDLSMEQSDVDGLQRSIVSKTTGAMKGQPLVLKGAKATRLGFNPAELDMRAARYAAEDRFCAVVGIPAVVMELGSGQEHSIYNNVQQAEKRAYQGYVIPIYNHIEEELDVQLLPDFEKNPEGFSCAHDLSKVPSLQEDEDKKATRLSGLWKDGVIQRGEARSGLNFGESVDGDSEADKIFCIPAGVTIVKPGEEIPEPGDLIDLGGLMADEEGGEVPPGEEDTEEEQPQSKPGEEQIPPPKAKPEGTAPAGTKSLPGKKQFIKPQDIDNVIRWLRKKKFSQAAAMITAKPLPANGGKTTENQTSV